MTQDQKRELERQLWNIADQLRGKMNADEFRDYCLGFIFYKYLSERLHRYANNILSEDEMDFLEIDETSAEGEEYLAAIQEEAVAELGYFLRPAELFASLASRSAQTPPEFILDDLTQVLTNIENSTMGTASEDDFDKLFEDLDLTSSKLGRSENDKNRLIARILVHLDAIDFRLDDSESDVLGDAYEYLIGQFASGAGKKAGEFYTPQQVSTVLARIVTTGKTRLKSVYDPTCGSGSLLLRVAREVEHVGDFYGQEMNRTTYNLARMNMLLHGVHYRNFNLKQEDTLERPQHEGMKFEAVVANPPFSAKWSANKLFEADDRFSQYGKLAPKSRADFAFIQHMLHHLDDNGVMAVVAPHGVLFRGGAEAHIRRYLIEQQNWLDAVIGLPANLFYGTSIPTSILVFKKCREYPDDVLFIDASGDGHFEKLSNQNMLRPQDIDMIVTTYRQRIAEEKYSAVVLLSEIEENDYNLNIPLYVDTFEKEAPIDLDNITKKLALVYREFERADSQITKYCNELGIPIPVGNNATLLKTYKRGVLQKLFSQEVRFTRNDGKSFPDWEKKKLSELAEDGFSNGVFNDPKKVGSGYRLINVKDMYQGNFIDIDQLTLLDLSQTEFAKNKVQYGDIFFTRSSLVKEGIAWSNVFLGHQEDITYDGHLIKMSLDTNSVNPYFIAQMLRTQFLRKQIVARGKTGTMTTIGQNDLASVSCFLPTLEEQHKIANFLMVLDNKIMAVDQQIEQIETLKRLLQ